MERKQKVTLLRLVRTDKGWTRRKVPVGGTRGWETRLDSNLVAYGADVLDLGDYQVRWFENVQGKSKPKYESGGATYGLAKIKEFARRDILDAIHSAARAGMEIVIPGSSQPLKDRLEAFLKERVALGKISGVITKDGLEGETPNIYRRDVAEFVNLTHVRYIEQVKKDTLVQYLYQLQERGLADQTQLNKFNTVGAFLRACDPGLGQLISEHTPKVKKKTPIHYTREEMDTLLAYLCGETRIKGTRRNLADDYRIALAVETYLKTGVRDKELHTLTWDMVDLKHGLITIKDDRKIFVRTQGKPREEIVNTKSRRDRKFRLPIEPVLLEKLRQWRQDHPGYRFLFPTSQGNPDRHILLRVKIAAYRAGLACGHCSHCLQPCGECQNCKCGNCKRCRTSRRCMNPHHGVKPCTRIQCEKWKLHRLRHTFATNAVRSGKVDLPMLMNLLGHEKLSTTQIYISAAQESEAQAAVNAMYGH